MSLRQQRGGLFGWFEKKTTVDVPNKNKDTDKNETPDLFKKTNDVNLQLFHKKLWIALLHNEGVMGYLPELTKYLRGSDEYNQRFSFYDELIRDLRVSQNKSISEDGMLQFNKAKSAVMQMRRHLDDYEALVKRAKSATSTGENTTVFETAKLLTTMCVEIYKLGRLIASEPDNTNMMFSGAQKMMVDIASENSKQKQRRLDLEQNLADAKNEKEKMQKLSNKHRSIGHGLIGTNILELQQTLSDRALDENTKNETKTKLSELQAIQAYTKKNGSNSDIDEIENKLKTMDDEFDKNVFRMLQAFCKVLSIPFNDNLTIYEYSTLIESYISGQKNAFDQAMATKKNAMDRQDAIFQESSKSDFEKFQSLLANVRNNVNGFRRERADLRHTVNKLLSLIKIYYKCGKTDPKVGKDGESACKVDLDTTIIKPFNEKLEDYPALKGFGLRYSDKAMAGGGGDYTTLQNIYQTVIVEDASIETLSKFKNQIEAIIAKGNGEDAVPSGVAIELLNNDKLAEFVTATATSKTPATLIASSEKATAVTSLKQNKAFIAALGKLLLAQIEEKIKKLQSVAAVAAVAAVPTVPAPPDHTFSSMYKKLLEKYDSKLNVMTPMERDLELVQESDANPGVSLKTIEVTLIDRFAFVMFFIAARAIALFITRYTIRGAGGMIRTFQGALTFLISIYTIVFIAFVLLVNINDIFLRVLFNYVNLHNGASKVIVHMLLLWMVALLSYQLLNVTRSHLVANADIIAGNVEFDVAHRDRLIHNLEVVSFWVWLIICITIMFA